jgi:hypothetical protein
MESRAGNGDDGDLLFNEYTISVCNEKVDSGGDCTTLCLCTEMYT